MSGKVKVKDKRNRSLSTNTTSSDVIDYRGLDDELLYTIEFFKAWTGVASVEASTDTYISSRAFAAQFWFNAALRACSVAMRLPSDRAPSLLAPHALLSNAARCRHLHQLCLSPCANYVAVVEHDRISLRSSHDNFQQASTLSEDLPPTNLPRWRRLCWTPDSKLLILIAGNGDVYVYGRENAKKLLYISGIFEFFFRFFFFSFCVFPIFEIKI